MRTRKLLSGLGAVMSLMMIIPWAVYADSPQVAANAFAASFAIL